MIYCIEGLWKINQYRVKKSIIKTFEYFVIKERETEVGRMVFPKFRLIIVQNIIFE